MKHEEYKRICEQSDSAILFIHGIVGTPNHFLKLLPMVPDSVSVYNMLLDGHGKSARDFSRTSMKKWVAQVEAAVNELAKSHRKIYIVGHSMGTLLAIEQAIKNESIAALFLMNVPLKIRLKAKWFATTMKIHFDRIKPEDHVALAAKGCYGIANDRNIFHYFGWIPRIFELFSKIRQIRRSLCNLKTPCTAFQAHNDELVATSSIKLLKQNPHISVGELTDSGHYYQDEADFKKLSESFRLFVGGILADQ